LCFSEEVWAWVGVEGRGGHGWLVVCWTDVKIVSAKQVQLSKSMT
jgi:hypothetical protein